MSLKYILDTNICIYISKEKPIEVLQKFEQLEVGDVGMSMITYAELLYGAKRSQQSKKSLKDLEQLISLIPVLPFQNNVAEHYADIRSDLSNKDTIIGNNDLWIAAHVRAMDKILVSNNLKEFQRVQKLKLENWIHE
ncbi:MAG: type II toxin-antitoxin system VapC family toxin [Ghiorsea sp.]|nr:type II toxin-antitoxin system VapC family toxin [Ghiorsea sp.]